MFATAADGRSQGAPVGSGQFDLSQIVGELVSCAAVAICRRQLRVTTILTNATSVLAMSTINRLLRTRDRMHELYAESEGATQFRGTAYVEQVNRVESQAMLLLRALRWIYVSLGAFAAASLVTLLGAVSGQMGNEILMGIVGNQSTA